MTMHKTLCFLLLSLFTATVAQDVVKVSSFNPQRDDATAACQAALDSHAKTIVFDNPGFAYIVSPLFFRSNCEIVFDDGVVIHALKGAFKGRNDCLLTGRSVENVTLRGIGTATLAMNKTDYQNPQLYSRGEWRHAISLLSTQNVTVRNLVVKSSGGDGVYVSTDSKINTLGAPCRNILLENLILDDHHRQGISVISADGLVIRHCLIMNTRGTAPMCGIDFEPNRQDEKLLNCLVEDCDFISNARAAILVCTGGLQDPIQITVRNCRMLDNASGLDINGDWKPLAPSRGSIHFQNCLIKGSGSPLVIRQNRKDLHISFQDCIIDNADAKAATEIYLRTQYTEDMAGLDFGNFIIKHAPKSRAVAFDGEAGAGLVRPNGSLTLVADDGRETPFDLDAFADHHRRNEDLLNFQTLPVQTGNLVAATPAARPGDVLGLRGKAIDFLQFADGSHPVNIRFKTLWAPPQNTQTRLPVDIYDPIGQLHGKFIIDSKDYVYAFKPAVSGTFLFKINTAGGSLHISSNGPGQAYGATRRLGLFRSNGRLYFQVPAGVRKITIEIAGDPPQEAVEAKLLNPAGQIMASVPHRPEAQLLNYERQDASATELWSVQVLNADEDCSLRLGAPLPPYLYTTPDNALKAR